jgi:hypothetical protein
MHEMAGTKLGAMLPKDFHWKRQTASNKPTEWLCLGKAVVGYVSQDIHERWYALADRHLHPDQWKQVYCRDAAQGKGWLERWAVRDEARLRQEVAEEGRPAVPP